MMHKKHKVFHYGHQDSFVPCHEHVSVVGNADYDGVFYGLPDVINENFAYNPTDTIYETYNDRTYNALLTRQRDGDFLLPFWSMGHKSICDKFPNLIVVDLCIDYPSYYDDILWSRWKIFESRALYDQYVGDSVSEELLGGNVVIPSCDNPNKYCPSPVRDPYFLYYGKIKRSELLDTIVAATKKEGVVLYLCGPGFIEDYEQCEHVVIVDPITTEKKNALLAHARAVFVLSKGPEKNTSPFIEVLLSGTPLITSSAGAGKEYNIQGITGFTCTTYEEFCVAIRSVDSIISKTCRMWGMQFSHDNVGYIYERYFTALCEKNQNHTRDIDECLTCSFLRCLPQYFSKIK
jgi:glycosyltransferase involved in cell wall biosynthesis